MKKSKCVALVSLLMAGIIGGSVIAAAPGAKAEAVSICILPGRTANKGQVKIPAWEAEESAVTTECAIAEQVNDVPNEETSIREIVLHVEITRIAGIAPTSNNIATVCQMPESPVTKEEILMLAKTLTQECGGLSSQGTKYGVSYTARQAGVAWCAFNRVDSPDFPNTLREVLTYPGAFAYNPNKVADPEMEWLAQDIADRWWREKCGEEYVGRTLPANYFFFAGDGKENRFRDNYAWPFVYWDWSLPDPYEALEDLQ